jgi:tetratricopeptide (TPR) repeat protein
MLILAPRHTESAIAACTRAIDSGQWGGHDLAILYNDRGIEYKNKNDYNDAIVDFNQSIRADPQYALAFNSRCNTYSAMGNNSAALSDYNMAIQLNPKYVEAYINRGTVYAETNQIDLAMADLNQAILTDPTDANAYQIRGVIEGIKGDTAAAATDTAKAKQLSSPSAAAPPNATAAACSVANQILGTWGMRFSDGSTSCSTYQFSNGGKGTGSSQNCSGGASSDGTGAFSWSVNPACHLLLKTATDSAEWTVSFNGNDAFTVAGQTGTYFRK